MHVQEIELLSPTTGRVGVIIFTGYENVSW
ncbi:hypothetical protein AF72_06645 [Xylella taiwanensis]|uniref:Uncharacterized protein n=1 Tax=Xylella taiwanensis TaxID=1444770 RepID=Z9JKA1_9GAMM|nr:hypothetical protein AF72_06645 [Xylella taiwanensis]